MPIRTTLTAIALTLGLTAANAATKVKPWQKGILESQVIACPTVQGVLSLIEDDDQWEAGMRAIKAKCVVVAKGEEVLATNEKGGFTCFSYKDRPHSCLWVLSDFIIPKD